MVKEFQQLRKQMTQILLENQQLKKESIGLIAKEVEEKENLFIDLIKLIEQLDLKAEIATKTLNSALVTNQDLPNTYNNIKNDLIQLLVKYDVQPIIGQNRMTESEKEGGSHSKEEGVYPKKRYSYRGKFLNK